MKDLINLLSTKLEALTGKFESFRETIQTVLAYHQDILTLHEERILKLERDNNDRKSE